MIYEDNKQLIKFIKEEARKDNRTMASIADSMGISRQGLSGMMNRGRIKVDHLNRIANACDCDLEIIFKPKFDFSINKINNR